MIERLRSSITINKVTSFTTTEKPVILVVDDAPESIDVARGALASEFQVRAAINGAKALDLVAQSQPDLILLDVMMPDMSGYEVCKRLKQDSATSEIPILFVTAVSEPESEAMGLDLGAVDYVTKPYVPALLRARVRAHVTLYRQHRFLEDLILDRTRELRETRLEIIRRLGRAAEYRDNETGMHVLRMSHICHTIALSYGMSEDRAELVLNVAPMHDIGKLGIPDRVLLKPGKLDPEEWEIMKRHTTIGAEIIGHHRSELMAVARVVALHHHEKWDGTGYPRGISGEVIPLEARVVALADVFDALLSERPYKKAWSLERTLEHIEDQSGLHFEPAMVEALLNRVDDCVRIRAEYADT